MFFVTLVRRHPLRTSRRTKAHRVAFVLLCSASPWVDLVLLDACPVNLMPNLALELELFKDPELAAESAGLRYVNADEPGILRRRRGRGFGYVGPQGQVVTAGTLGRIRALAIPPAWTNVWICSDARGHIQATGRDERGRKQYRYHAKWRAIRDLAKFEHLIAFAHVLPQIRRRVSSDLRLDGLPRSKVIAAVVKLLDSTRIRVGNEEYARDNHSFGLTTFRNRHVSIAGSTIAISFRGKSGRKHRVTLDDARLARIVRRCQELPGQRLFGYVDETGTVHEIESSDVNDYLRACCSADVSSKDFRTWAATVMATLALHAQGPRERETHRKRCVTQAVAQAAAVLGNTPAVCRRSYIHPAVIDGYLGGSLCQALMRCSARTTRQRGLDRHEQMVLRFLEAQQKQARAHVRRARAA